MQIATPQVDDLHAGVPKHSCNRCGPDLVLIEPEDPDQDPYPFHGGLHQIGSSTWPNGSAGLP